VHSSAAAARVSARGPSSGAAGAAVSGAAGRAAGSAAGGSGGVTNDEATIRAIYGGTPIINGDGDNKSANVCFNNVLAHTMNTCADWSALCDLDRAGIPANVCALLDALRDTRDSARGTPVSHDQSLANADRVISALHAFAPIHVNGIPLAAPPSGGQHALDEIVQRIASAIDDGIIKATGGAVARLAKIRDALSCIADETRTYAVPHKSSCPMAGDRILPVRGRRLPLFVISELSRAYNTADMLIEKLCEVSEGVCVHCRVRTRVVTTTTITNVPRNIYLYVPICTGCRVSPSITVNGRLYNLDVIANRTGAVYVSSNERTGERQFDGHWTFCRLGEAAPDAAPGAARPAVLLNDARVELCDYTSSRLRSSGLFRYRLAPSAGAGAGSS
jgi:hypothetical protein